MRPKEGRHKLIEYDELKKVNKYMQQHDGLTFPKKDVNKLLGNIIGSNIITLGHVPLVPTVLNRQSLNNYTATLISAGRFVNRQ